MSSQKATVDYIIDQIAAAGSVSSRKMFGEYAIYCDGKRVALVCDDLLFLKPTARGRAFLGHVEERPPYPGAKPCFFIAGDTWEDAEWISDLIRISASELPVPQKKRTSK